MRIDKLLANMGYGSRKEVKKLLKSGAVKLEDQVVKDGKTAVNPDEDAVSVFGDIVEYKEFIYLMMNKPAGVISATEDREHETVIDLLEDEHLIFEPFPVGRLDLDTEGLLLLTNDGQLSHQLLAPKKHVPKTYYAEISGIVTNEDVEAFSNGVSLDDGYHTKPAQLTIENVDEDQQTSQISLIITEGKFHQVKRMFQAVGKQVTYLKRIKMANLPLDADLELGEYRELTEEELAQLKGYQQLER